MYIYTKYIYYIHIVNVHITYTKCTYFTVTNTSLWLKIWRKMEIPPLPYCFSSRHLPRWLNLTSRHAFFSFTIMYFLTSQSCFKSTSFWGRSHINFKLAISNFVWIHFYQGTEGNRVLTLLGRCRHFWSTEYLRKSCWMGCWSLSGLGDCLPRKETPGIRGEFGTNVPPMTDHHCRVSALRIVWLLSASGGFSKSEIQWRVWWLSYFLRILQNAIGCGRQRWRNQNRKSPLSHLPPACEFPTTTSLIPECSL